MSKARSPSRPSPPVTGSTPVRRTDIGWRAAVMALQGEVSGSSASGFVAVAQQMLASGASPLALDCTAITGVSGHLLGALTRLAAEAERRRVRIGVAAAAGSEDAIRGHLADVIVVGSMTDLFARLGVDPPVHAAVTVGRRRDPDQTRRHLWWRLACAEATPPLV